MNVHSLFYITVFFKANTRKYFQTDTGKVKSLSRVQLFASPWTVACQAPPSMGFSRQEYCSGLPFPSPGDLSYPGIKPESPALQADSLPSELPGSPSRFRRGNPQNWMGRRPPSAKLWSAERTRASERPIVPAISPLHHHPQPSPCPLGDL